jgi:phage terminase large subunit-like protein
MDRLDALQLFVRWSRRAAGPRRRVRSASSSRLSASKSRKIAYLPSNCEATKEDRNSKRTAKHGIWIDEPPAPLYDECLLCLMTTNGLMLCTFTPLKGLSEIRCATNHELS